VAISPGGRPADASPLGRKGGPRRLTDYTREVAHALMREHGYPESKAIAIARAAIAKWAVGGNSGAGRGHVHPQVQAAAAASTIHQHILDHQRRRGSR